MNLSVMSPVLNGMSLEEAIKYLSSLGVDSIEIGAGGYPGKAHLDPKEYLNNPAKVQELKDLLKKYNLKFLKKNIDNAFASTYTRKGACECIVFLLLRSKKWACTRRNRGKCHFMTFRWRENVQSTFLFYIM